MSDKEIVTTWPPGPTFEAAARKGCHLTDSLCVHTMMCYPSVNIIMYNEGQGQNGFHPLCLRRLVPVSSLNVSTDGGTGYVSSSLEQFRPL